MPIYEYQCAPCRQTFETLIRSASDIAQCPKCGSVNVVKQLSIPAAAQSARSSSLPVCGQATSPGSSCNRPECSSGTCAFE
jgi:putative FmdB family regulatory protein